MEPGESRVVDAGVYAGAFDHSRLLETADIEAAPFFALLDKLANDHGLEGRSMGMSDDFQTAIMLGATHIRVGTALFGERAAA